MAAEIARLAAAVALRGIFHHQLALFVIVAAIILMSVGQKHLFLSALIMMLTTP
jgi:hypothetical protein